ncbi:MAG: AmmeMemoRadiSam system protein B, partial [Planctomycetota bacterium]
ATQQDLPPGAVENVCRQLEEALFLDSPHFQAFMKEVEEEYASSPLRTASCAGSVYPVNVAELTRTLQAMIDHAPLSEAARWDSPGVVRGAIAPHIDYERGHDGYGQTYRELCSIPKPKVVVILGTAHRPLAHRYSLTRKDFETPLGVLPNATAVTERLARSGEADLFEGEIAHLYESSIELQVPFLQHIWGPGISIVPVLCGSLADEIESGFDPCLTAETASFTRVLGEIAREQDGGLFLLASADLSHVGAAFGEERELDGAYLQEVEAVDRAYLSACLAGDAKGSIRELFGHKNRTGICSAACLHALLTALAPCEGRLLGYHQAANREIQNAVTFGAAIYR